MATGDSVTVTFLFTDIEGSTQRWETDSKTMAADLEQHDRLLRSVISRHDGELFKHTGDGVCAAFPSAGAGVAAAIEAQQQLQLPVRMGLASGDAQPRDADYFGRPLNRAARVMAVAHGGQILVEGLTAALAGDIDFIDLGEHQLKGLGDTTRIYQVRAQGLADGFPSLKTLAAAAGNLPTVATRLIGRNDELAEITALVKAEPLVTLTAFGGVGKTRLALAVAADLADDFDDGVWLVELAPVGDPGAVPNVVATTMGVTPASDRSVVEGVARALADRRCLLVLDNCEHVLRAAADLADTLRRFAPGITILATSREPLGLAGERVSPVPTLGCGPGAAALELFVERAQAVRPGFELGDEVEAVVDLCTRLDGVALAIELAAARMVSMGATEVRDRIDHRFRLLAEQGRSQEHHRTLRQAVSWSYDLLAPDEQQVLARCSVFSDGFDVAAATEVCGNDDADEYRVLDLLHSLVKKSLVTADVGRGASRYRLLQTIRQFALEELGSSGDAEKMHRRHAEYFAREAIQHWRRWDGPDQLGSLNWVDTELSNLRSAFRWAADHDALPLAASLAAHSAMLAFILQRFEPVSWAEELLPAATEARVRPLPQLATAAAVCGLTGRPDAAVERAAMAIDLEGEEGFECFEPYWSRFWLTVGHRYAGRIEEWFEITDELASRAGTAGVVGSVNRLSVLPGVGRAVEAREVAEATVAAARALGNPCWIAFALTGLGRAQADVDPAVAMDTMVQCLDYAREHRLAYFEATVTREIGGLEEVLGEPGRALELFDSAVALCHRAGNHGSVATALADVTVLFERLGCTESAATIYGISTCSGISLVPALPAVLDRLRKVLGAEEFERLVAEGAAREFDEGMSYVREEIAEARRVLDGAGNEG